jgi:hypothetical protein
VVFRVRNALGGRKRGGSSESYEDWSKANLYKRAKEVGIECRSSASKGQLVKALRNS